MKIIFTHYFEKPEENTRQVLAVRQVLWNLYLQKFGKLPSSRLIHIPLSVCEHRSQGNCRILQELRQLSDVHFSLMSSAGYSVCHGEDVARFRDEIIRHYSPVVISPLTSELDRDGVWVGVVIIEPQYLEIIPDFLLGIVNTRFPKDFSGANAKPHSGSVFVLSTDTGSVAFYQETPDMSVSIDEMADEYRTQMGGVGVGTPIRRSKG